MLIPNEIESLLEILGQSETFARLKAEKALADFGDVAVEPLICLLQTGTLKQIASAITVLAMIGDHRAIAPFIELLHAPHALLRMSVAKALEDFKSAQVVEALIGSLNDPNELVQTWVVHSLGESGDIRALEPLLELLQENKSSDLCYMIIRTLGQMGDPYAVEHILPYLDNDNRHVQREARVALAKLGSPDAPQEIEK